ncbi:Bile acid:sodium symporter [Natrialba chahannaoensis JCM 10990]|uniref:Bile acid:sodium symporter n=1 Tax=Natrialba chahannaoensis JCM 10990 TaxID=1227492 RepID=M0ATM3_9EURY|nr:arsenic resistance protein [Natrialba chahannaoensis]ELZ01682.1 Bile acid:sodium symporter [Natrialba chahannaoensis JCM 10990]
MNALERYQTPTIALAIAGGLVAGQFSGIPSIADRLILPFLLVMLFGAFLQIPLADLHAAVGNRRVAGASLAINFVWNPLLAVGLGFVFLQDQPALWVGLLMLLVTPCTDWYLIFTDLADGDVALATSLLPYNLVLQLLLLPVYLAVFAGELVTLPLETLAESILLVLVIPLGAAAIGRVAFSRHFDESVVEETLLPAFGPVQIVFLALAIAAMFASQSTVLVANPGVLALLAVPVLAFYTLTFLLGLVVSAVGGFSYEETVCLTCTILSRNSPTALAIAVVAFPHEPLVAMALVIGPLLELPLLHVVTRLLCRLRDRPRWARTSVGTGVE